MRNKKTKLSKRQSQTSKDNQHSLTSFLLKKHIRIEEVVEPSAQTAMVLETILTGSDQRLQVVLESWLQSYALQGSAQAIEALIKGWGPSNSLHLFNRLLTFLDTEKKAWTYPWIKAILSTGINLTTQFIGQLNASLGNQSTAPLSEILRLEGKLQLFDR